MSRAPAPIKELRARLESIGRHAAQLESDLAGELAQVHPKLRDSASNLIWYMALRHTDIRDLQQQLELLGLSSLGHAELHTKSSLQSVLRNLNRLYFGEPGILADERRDIVHSEATLAAHDVALLGAARMQRSARIMVTLPSDAADRPELVASLIDAGMDIARINTAHDNKAAWRRMVENVRRSNAAAAASCRIVMDLAGPKIRTGPIKPGPRVRRVRPRRDPLGRVIAPRRLRLVDKLGGAAALRAGTLPVPRKCLDTAREGGRLTFRDARGKKRTLRVVGRDKRGLIVEIFKTAYIETGTVLRLRQQDSGDSQLFRVGALPPIELPLLLKTGDTLILHAQQIDGEPAVIDASDHTTRPAHIACMPPEVLRYVRPGAAIRLHDGKIEGTVRTVSKHDITVDITRAKPTGNKLRAGKAIHFPGSRIRLAGLTEADKGHLAFVAEHADAIGLSYIKSPQDVVALQKKLAALPPPAPGIILKIETEEAFRNLPRVLLTAMRSYPVGVMIARGDLALECGWERLAEMQEEILWLCEAARLPVVWATQVLEGETKKGRPSRAEITDAAMAQRADCVMLNKGRYIIDAIRMLDDILKRMQRHQKRKTPRMRKLSISDLDGTDR